MQFDAHTILEVLDRCCDHFRFPMLDNGYVYLAGTRLSLHRTAADWAIVIEVFGFSPRVGLPDTHIYTFASTVHNRNPPEKYVTPEAYERYLANNPHNESRFVHPIEDGPWQDQEDDEFLAEDAREIVVRGKALPVPRPDEYEQRGIKLEEPPQVQVLELSRFLADVARESVLATAEERRLSILPEMTQVLQLEEWHHPNIVDDNDRPSRSETFQQLAQVLATGEVGFYRPTLPPNTHWRNWPEGGRL